MKSFKEQCDKRIKQQEEELHQLRETYRDKQQKKS